MAYLSPHFDYDIFISYAHANNAKGWVSRLHNDLLIELNGILEGVTIWRDDQELRGNTLFNEKIKNSVNRSALFLAVSSSRYFKSVYCRDELRWFHQKAAQDPCGRSLNSEGRLFNLLIHDIPHTEWPDEYTGITQYKFFDSLGLECNQSEKGFEVEVKKLAVSICKLLDNLKQVLPNQPAGNLPPPPPANGPTVFLAATASALKVRREQVLNELSEKGINVITKVPPPRDSAGHDKRVREVMKQTDLSVHLLCEDMGDEMDETPEKSYSQRQVELGMEEAKSQFVWIPPSLDIESPEIYAGHRLFLQDLVEKERAASHRVRREKPTDLSRVIVETLEEIKKARETPLPPALSSVLLNTHAKDQVHALELYKILLDRKVQPYLEPEQEDSLQGSSLLAQRMKQVSRLIIVFGSADEEWVLSRLGQAMQLAITQKCQIKTYGIYLAPPRTRAKDGNFSFPPWAPVYPFDQHDIADSQKMRQILESA
jgi:hypothetical protein